MIRVKLPLHLRRLAGVDGDVLVGVSGVVTQRTVLDAVESEFPALVGAMRDRTTGQRRSLLRLFACGEDLSNDDPDRPLPDAVAGGSEPFLIVGAIAGG